MSKQVPGGIDNGGNRLKGVAIPTDPADAVRYDMLRMDLAFQCINTKPGAGEVVGALPIPVACKLPANLANSIARALTAATGSAAWTLSVIPAGSATETTIATITFAAGATLGTFSTQAAFALGVGDLVRLKAPATADSTLADISFIFPAVR